MLTGVLAEDRKKAHKLSGIKGVDVFYSHEWPFEGEKSVKTWIQLLPYVMRAGSEVAIDERADGVLVRTYDELGWVLSSGYEGRVITDHTLYTANSRAVQALLSDGAELITCPLEFNSRDLKLRGFMDRSVLCLYGRAPLMISANCIRKNALELCKLKREDMAFGNWEEDGRGATLCKQNLVSVKDRKGVVFPVLTECRHCYNVIYNSVPTSLHKDMDIVRDLNPAECRVDITVEDVEEAGKAIEYYVNLLKGKKTTPGAGPEIFTHGGFNKGNSRLREPDA